jgi:hypothetical protein
MKVKNKVKFIQKLTFIEELDSCRFKGMSVAYAQ